MNNFIHLLAAIACCLVSISAYAFSPLTCTLNGQIVKRTDFVTITDDNGLGQRVILYFMDARESVERKTALYRARDVFNQNASAAKLQIIETGYLPSKNLTDADAPDPNTPNPMITRVNPYTLNWLEGSVDDKNIILFVSADTSKESYNWLFSFGGTVAIALNFPECNYFANSATISEAHVLLNEKFFLDSYTDPLTGSVLKLIERKLDASGNKIPLRDVSADIISAFPNDGYLKYYSFETLPEDVALGEDKEFTKYYSNNFVAEIKESIVSILLHELGHPFGLNHEPRYLNNMGQEVLSSNGIIVMDWLGEDITRFFSKMYPLPAGTEYRDLSVRHVERAGQIAGPTFWNLSSPVHQTAYAVSRRTRAYANSGDIYGPINFLPGSSNGNLVRYSNTYHRNPVECMVPGGTYYVDFLYENNGNIKDEGVQTVGFYISSDNEINPLTDTFIGQDSFRFFQKDANALDPSLLQFWMPYKFGPCYDPVCLVTTRRS